MQGAILTCEDTPMLRVDTSYATSDERIPVLNPDLNTNMANARR